MENDNLCKDLEKSMKKQMKSGAEKMLIRLIDNGYSKEIKEIFPPSIGIVLLKNFSYLFFVLAVISYLFTHSFLISIAIVVFGILCYWLSGLIRIIQLKKEILSNKKNFTKFNNLFKKLYE